MLLKLLCISMRNDFKYNRSLPFACTISPPSSCDSLSTLTLTGDAFTSASYQTIHILVDFTGEPQIQWVHFGKVRFISMDPEPDETCIESSGGMFYYFRFMNLNKYSFLHRFTI